MPEVGRGITIPFSIDLAHVEESLRRLRTELAKLEKDAGKLEIKIDGKPLKEFTEKAIVPLVSGVKNIDKAAQNAQARIDALNNAVKKLRGGAAIPTGMTRALETFVPQNIIDKLEAVREHVEEKVPSAGLEEGAAARLGAIQEDRKELASKEQLIKATRDHIFTIDKEAAATKKKLETTRKGTKEYERLIAIRRQQGVARKKAVTDLAALDHGRKRLTEKIKGQRAEEQKLIRLQNQIKAKAQAEYVKARTGAISALNRELRKQESNLAMLNKQGEISVQVDRKIMSEEELMTQVRQKNIWSLGKLEQEYRELDVRKKAGVITDKQLTRMEKLRQELRQRGSTLIKKELTDEEILRRVREKNARTVDKLQREYRQLLVAKRANLLTDRDKIRLYNVSQELQQRGIKMIAQERREMRRLGKEVEKIRAARKGGIFGYGGWIPISRVKWFVQLRFFWMLFRAVGDLKDAMLDLDDATAHAMRTLRSETESMAETQVKAFNTINDVAAKTGATYKDVGEALYQLSSAGLSAEESFAALESTIKLALVTKADMTTVTKTVAGIYNVLGDVIGKNMTLFEKFTEISEVLHFVWRKNQVDMDELVQALKHATAASKVFNVDFREMAVILGVAHSGMVRAGIAGRAWRNILLNLTLEAKNLANAWGITLDPTQPTKMIDILRQLADRYKQIRKSGMEIADMAGMVNKRAMTMLFTLLDRFEEVEEQLAQVGEQTETLDEQLYRLQSRFRGLAEVLWREVQAAFNDNIAPLDALRWIMFEILKRFKEARREEAMWLKESKSLSDQKLSFWKKHVSFFQWYDRAFGDVTLRLQELRHELKNLEESMVTPEFIVDDSDVEKLQRIADLQQEIYELETEGVVIKPAEGPITDPRVLTSVWDIIKYYKGDINALQRAIADMQAQTKFGIIPADQVKITKLWLERAKIAVQELKRANEEMFLDMVPSLKHTTAALKEWEKARQRVEESGSFQGWINTLLRDELAILEDEETALKKRNVALQRYGQIYEEVRRKWLAGGMKIIPKEDLQDLKKWLGILERLRKEVTREIIADIRVMTEEHRAYITEEERDIEKTSTTYNKLVQEKKKLLDIDREHYKLTDVDVARRETEVLEQQVTQTKNLIKEREKLLKETKILHEQEITKAEERLKDEAVDNTARVKELQRLKKAQAGLVRSQEKGIEKLRTSLALLLLDIELSSIKIENLEEKRITEKTIRRAEELESIREEIKRKAFESSQKYYETEDKIYQLRKEEQTKELRRVQQQLTIDKERGISIGETLTRELDLLKMNREQLKEQLEARKMALMEAQKEAQRLQDLVTGEGQLTEAEKLRLEVKDKQINRLLVQKKEITATAENTKRLQEIELEQATLREQREKAIQNIRRQNVKEELVAINKIIQERAKAIEAPMVDITPEVRARLEAELEVYRSRARTLQEQLVQERETIQNIDKRIDALQKEEAALADNKNEAMRLKGINEEINRLYKERADLLAKAEIPEEEVEAMRARIEELERTVRELTKALEETGKEVDNLGEKSKEWNNITKGAAAAWGDMEVAVTNFAEDFRARVNQMGTSFENNLTENLWDWIEGTKSAKEAWKDFAEAFLKEITKMLIKMALARALMMAMGWGAGAGGGEQTGGGGGGTYDTGTSGGVLYSAATGGIIPEIQEMVTLSRPRSRMYDTGTSDGTLYSAATGGIIPEIQEMVTLSRPRSRTTTIKSRATGGILPHIEEFKAMAGGGTTKGLTVALLGDNKSGKEIVIPTENIKEDSVHGYMRDREEKGETYIINVITSEDVAAAMTQSAGKNVIINTIGEDLRSKKSTFRAVQESQRR